MKTYLDHLPEHKQQNIKTLRDLILNEMESFIGAASGKKAYSEVLYIILFGSYAKGTYVDDPANGYISDYDILVILDRPELLLDLRLWHGLEDKAERRVKAPINLIVHTLKEVKEWLNEGQYFFSDIRREGIYLYASSGRELPEPKNLTDAERKPIAEKHFAQWFESANDFFDGYEFYRSKGKDKLAAFHLHQTAEKLYATLLLVLSNYRPKTHNIKRLHAMAIQNDKTIADIFPQDNRFNRRCFELLKRAYVDARYSEHYKITKEELTWLAEQVNQLKSSVERLCLSHIERLGKGAGKSVAQRRDV